LFGIGRYRAIGITMPSGLKKHAAGRLAPAMRVVTRLQRKGVRCWATALIVFVPPCRSWCE